MHRHRDSGSEEKPTCTYGCCCLAGIPVGDLFVAMESWDEPDRIKRSMDVILEIEAEAAKTVTAKAGLLELLQMLKGSDVGSSRCLQHIQTPAAGRTKATGCMLAHTGSTELCAGYAPPNCKPVHWQISNVSYMKKNR